MPWIYNADNPTRRSFQLNLLYQVYMGPIQISADCKVQTKAMLLPPPGGLREPRKYSLVSAFPSANMSLPVISLSLALLRGFSADTGGTSSLKILLPVSSANFWSCSFFDVFLTDSSESSPNKTLLWLPAGYKLRKLRSKWSHKKRRKSTG